MTACGELRRTAVVTCVAATSPRVEQIALRSLAATAAEFPDARRVAALDVSTDLIEAQCSAYGWQTLRLCAGKPPRMGKLLRLAFSVCADAEIVWTIEHDVEITRHAAAPAEALLLEHPDLAGVELRPLNPQGGPGYPLNRKKVLPYAADDRLRLQRPWASLNCIAWRASFLRGLDWSRIHVYPQTDQDISRQVTEAGLEVAVADQLTCVHRFSQARRDLAPITRAHYARVPWRWKKEFVA